MLVALLAGCGGDEKGARPITAPEALRALTASFDRPLVDNVITGPERSTEQIAASYTGGTADEHLVAVVFDTPGGVTAMTGADMTRAFAGPSRVRVIRVSNVVVLYTRSPGVIDREPAMRDALRRAAAG